MQKSNGTGNFQDNIAIRNWLSGTLMNSLNGRMGGLQAMNLPTSSPTINDCRVRFTLANIYFWQDDFGWSFQQSWDFGNYLHSNYVTKKSNVSNKDNSVHIFMSENGNGYKGRVSDIGDKSWIIINAVYTGYLSNDSYGNASIIAHELGHSMGLNHTWDGDECNDTPNNDNCWNVNESNNGHCVIPSNNLMDYNANANALTMCQINRIHYFLLGGEGNIGDCIVSGATVVNPTIVGSDLICSSGATYTLDNLQLGVTSRWSITPTIFLRTYLAVVIQQMPFLFLLPLEEKVRSIIRLIGKSMEQALFLKMYGLEKSVKLTCVRLIEILIKLIIFFHQ